MSERARKHYETHRYDFSLVDEDSLKVEHVYLTTKDASDLANALANLGTCIIVEAIHPEFLGWTIEEIANHMETEAQ